MSEPTSITAATYRFKHSKPSSCANRWILQDSDDSLTWTGPHDGYATPLDSHLPNRVSTGSSIANSVYPEFERPKKSSVANSTHYVIHTSDVFGLLRLASPKQIDSKFHYISFRHIGPVFSRYAPPPVASSNHLTSKMDANNGRVTPPPPPSAMTENLFVGVTQLCSHEKCIQRHFTAVLLWDSQFDTNPPLVVPIALYLCSI